MEIGDNFYQLVLSECSIPKRNLFSSRNYTNSLEQMDIKDTRHRTGSPLMCALGTRITCEINLNWLKCIKEFILYLGQGMIKFATI